MRHKETKQERINKRKSKKEACKKNQLRKKASNKESKQGRNKLCK